MGFLLTLAILFVSLATPVFADGPDSDVVVWGENYTLEPGERIKGDLLVYGGNVNLKADSEVDGNVTVFGGNLTIAGEVKGGVTVWGGNVKIKSDATVRGKVVSVGGNVSREKGADVRGGEVQGWPIPPLSKLPKPPAPTPPRLPGPLHPPRVRMYRPWRNDLLRRVGDVFRSAFGVLVLVVLGILVVAFIPRHTETVAETMTRAPVQSFSYGLVALIAGSIVLVATSIVGALLVATVCLAPIGLLLLLPLLVAGVAFVFGWIAAGLLFGAKILRALTHREPNHILAVAIGIALLSALSFIPCVGWLLALIVAIWSLGAVIYSLFGTRTVSSTPTFPGASPTTAGTAQGYDPRMDQL